MEQIEMTDVYKEWLFRIPLFKDLTLDRRQSILDNLDYFLYKLSKNEIVAKQDTTCEHLYILIEGKLRVDIIEAFGNEIMIEHIIAPRAFATPHLFSADPILPATFKSLEEGILLKASKKSVFALISQYPDLLKSFLCISGNCNKCTTLRMRSLSHKGVRARFVSYLFEQKKTESNIIQIEHNQVQLADYLCITRPALTKEISKMIKEGFIKMDGKKIELVRVNELKRMIL